MSKSVLIAATTVLFVAAGTSSAFAQTVICQGFGLTSVGAPMAYHGYSNQPATLGAPGTSTVQIVESTKVTPTADCTGSTTTKKTTTNYIGGPGKSDFSKHDSTTTTCEATGTGVCP